MIGGFKVSNVVKLKGFERTVIEQFQHDPDFGTWHFEVTVWEATPEEYSAAFQRLKPSEMGDYQAGDLNLMRLKIDAYVDPVWLGSYSPQPVWIKGQTFTGGKLRTESGKAIDSSWFAQWCRMAIGDGMQTLANVLGQLRIGDARDEVERRAGLR